MTHESRPMPIVGLLAVCIELRKLPLLLPFVVVDVVAVSIVDVVGIVVVVVVVVIMLVKVFAVELWLTPSRSFSKVA